MDAVNEALEQRITARLAIVSIRVMEARIGYLACAPEIANAVLKRQQAIAIVAVRKKSRRYSWYSRGCFKQIICR